MTDTEKLARLQKRADFLAERVAAGIARGQDLSHDKAELSALQWAIDTLTPISRKERDVR